MFNILKTRIKKISNFMNKIALIYALIMAILMFVIVVLGVIVRYILVDPFVWVEELSRYLMIIMALFGISLAIEREENIKIDFLIDRFSLKVRNIIKIILDILILPFLLLLVYQGTILAWESRMQLTESLNISKVFIMVNLPISAIFMLVQLLSRVVIRLSDLNLNNSRKEDFKYKFSKKEV